MWQKHGAGILNCNRHSYGAAKTIKAHTFKFNWLVLNCKQIRPIFFFFIPYIKSMFLKIFGVYLEGDAVGSTKKMCTRASLQNAVHDKSHPETRSLCAFCRVVVPTQLFTNTALYYKMIQNAAWIWTNPPCYKMFLGCLMVDQKPMWVTTKWLRERVAVKNPNSLLNHFWKFHSKSLVYFPGSRL